MSESTIKSVEDRYEVETDVGSIAFTGVLLAEVRTDVQRRQPRWTELALYRITKGPNTGMYVLETVGRSDVYHRFGGPCKFGRRTDRSELTETSVPCKDCNPDATDGSPLGTIVSMETDRPRGFECRQPEEVLKNLKDRYTGLLSAPARSLLEEAVQVDDGIRSLMSAVREI